SETKKKSRAGRAGQRCGVPVAPRVQQSGFCLPRHTRRTHEVWKQYRVSLLPAGSLGGFSPEAKEVASIADLQDIPRKFWLSAVCSLTKITFIDFHAKR